MGSQPAGKKAAGLAQKAFDLLAAQPPPFFFRPVVFSWPDERKLHEERAFVFSFGGALFSWPVFLFGTKERMIFWQGPGRETSNQIHIP